MTATAAPPRAEGTGVDPSWARPALYALLGATALLYLWGLGASGYANTFYAAAVQAGTHSFKAAFFGASDAAGSITVDKSPLFLWPMELSARVFGVNGWSLLVPQALEGVASVALLYAAVKRWFGPAAGLVAGAALALTPVSVLMFRFNNPDAMLVLLLTAAGYAMVRALEKGGTNWVALCFALVGLGFLAKMLQALLVVPAFGLVYLLAGPPQLARRMWQLTIGTIAMIAAAGWWVAVVELTPASARPYVGGSQDNSVLNLIFGYNGFGRLTGNESGSVGGRRAGAGGRWGETGLLRMFNANFGGQASWLIPTALVLLVVGLVVTARRDRHDRTRAALVLWGGWLVITALTFSFGRGIIHEYYTVALAPGVGGTIGVGGALVWRARSKLWARASMAAACIVTGWWAAVLLHRTPQWNPWLAPLVLIVSAVAVGLILVGHAIGAKVLTGAVVAAIGAGVVGPAAYAIDTASATHGGAIPSAGPAGQRRSGPGGARGPAGGRAGVASPRFALPQVGPNFARPAFAGGAPPLGFGGATGRGPGQIGGLLESSKPDREMTDYLLRNAKAYKWVAATVGANEAAGYQIATDKSVMPVGGFNGTDPSPTLAQFQAWVASHKIHYFVSTGRGLGGPGTRGGGSGPRRGTSRAITAWVESTFSSTTMGRVVVYDLTSPLATGVATSV